MKRVLSIIAVLTLVTVFFSGCSETADTASGSADGSDISTVSVDESGYEDSFDGFVQYMTDGGYIKGNGVELTASVIGAAQGKRYTVSSGMGKYSVELYEYEDQTSEAASKTIANAKNSGTFNLFETTESSTENTVAAVTDDGRFLMLFTESSSNDSTAAAKEAAVEAVKAFGK